MADEGKAGFDQDEDLAGPISVAVVGIVRVKEPEVEKDAASLPDKFMKEEGRFIVFGDSDFVTNAYVNLQGNGDLFYSAISWLAEEGDLISIRPKETEADPLMMSSFQQRLVFWLPVVALPLIVLIVGGLVVTRRRGR